MAATSWQKSVPIGPDDSAPEVYERVCQATIDLVLEAYPLLAAGTRRASPRITRREFHLQPAPRGREIDWSKPTRAIYNQVRALDAPYPGAYTFLWREEGDDLAGCSGGSAPRYAGRIPGRVVAVSKAEEDTGDYRRRRAARHRSAGSAARTRRPPPMLCSVRATLGVRTSDLLARIQALEEIVVAQKVPEPRLTMDIKRVLITGGAGSSAPIWLRILAATLRSCCSTISAAIL